MSHTVVGPAELRDNGWGIPPGIIALVEFVQEGWKKPEEGFLLRNGVIHRGAVIVLAVVITVVLLYYYLLVVAGLGLLGVTYVIALAISGLDGLILAIADPHHHQH